MNLITNLIPNPLFMLPDSTIVTSDATVQHGNHWFRWRGVQVQVTSDATVQHGNPDRLIITPSSGAVNPLAKIRLCEPVSGDFHLNFWIFQVPEGSRWYENGITYVSNAAETGGVLLPHNNTGGATFLGFDFHVDDMQFIQLKCPLNHPLQFSAINLMTQADWREYKKFVPGMGALYGDLMPRSN